MKILFYAPFKPLNHRNPSGDQIIARGLFNFLEQQGHTVCIASNLRCRWIYWKLWLLPMIVMEWFRVKRLIRSFQPDLWLTYHSYYKAPDILGPKLCQQYNLPYCIFQGQYATKYQRDSRFWPGFYLNRLALLRAAHLFSNRAVDQNNLLRLIPEKKITAIGPGIFPDQMSFSDSARKQQRQQWQSRDIPVILSAAMFRADVKTEGLIWLMHSLALLNKTITITETKPFKLVIAGDGCKRKELEELARHLLPNQVIFQGKIKDRDMAAFYSGGDLFAFPGINESLGMVYLEAQSCGLPVVAFANGGIPEVVCHNKTGFLTPLYDRDSYNQAINMLLTNKPLRKKMGRQAADYVRTSHDLYKNYQLLQTTLQIIAQK